MKEGGARVGRWANAQQRKNGAWRTAGPEGRTHTTRTHSATGQRCTIMWQQTTAERSAVSWQLGQTPVTGRNSNMPYRFCMCGRTERACPMLEAVDSKTAVTWTSKGPGTAKAPDELDAHVADMPHVRPNGPDRAVGTHIHAASQPHAAGLCRRARTRRATSPPAGRTHRRGFRSDQAGRAASSLAPPWSLHKAATCTCSGRRGRNLQAPTPPSSTAAPPPSGGRGSRYLYLFLITGSCGTSRSSSCACSAWRGS